MARTLKFTIDTCSLTAMRRVYPKDVFPSVWDSISEWADSGIIASIDLVYDELSVQDDVVLEWADDHYEFFHPLDTDIQTNGTSVLAKHPNLIDLKKRKSGADPFVIGHAITYKTSVVTEEKRVGPGANYTKIPNVCPDFGVDCINLLEMLRRLRVKL